MRNILTNSFFNCVSLIGFICVVIIYSPVSAQSDEEFSVPANMTVEGIPPIKKSEVEHLFFDPSQIRNNLIWDVDRKNRSILVTDEKSYIYRVATPMAKPEILIDGRIPNIVRVDPMGGRFAFTDDKDDADNFELYLWDGEKPLRKLSTFTGKDESVESLLWNKTGDKLIYTQADYELKTTKLCVHDLKTSSCPLTDLKGIWYVLDSDGENVLLKYWKASSNQSLYRYNLLSKKLETVEDEGNSTKAFITQGQIVWLSDGSIECGSHPCLMGMNLTTGKRRKLTLPNDVMNLQDIKPSPNGKSILIQDSQNGIDQLRIGKLKNAAVVKTGRPFVYGSYVVWSTRWLSDKEVVFTIENVGKPASVVSFDIDLKRTISWTKEKLPKLLENKIRPPELVKWKSFDERIISGYLVKPKTAQKKAPVLIFIHGGPQTIDQPTFSLSDIRLAGNLGLAIIHTNIRGSKGFGIDFMDADNGSRRGDAVKDIRSLINWIGKQPGLDSSRIFLRGESYGGFIALATGLQEPERIKAVIAEYPLVSIRGYLSQSWIDEFAINEYGNPKDEGLMKKLDELSPLNNAKRWNKIPMFLTRGKLDARVPEGDVLGLKDQLQESEAEVWFIYANEAGHGVGGRYVTAAMYEFLKKQVNKEKEK